MKTILAALVASFLAVSMSAAAVPAGRVSQTIDGIQFDYDPADESFARALAPLIAALNREKNAPLPPAPAPAADAPATPLSIADFRRNRADYLARIAAAIGLDKPTALQEECYDGYLDNFERTEELFALLMERTRAAFEFHAVTVVHKTDLLRRLKAGEKIAGFTLDPDGEHGSAEWSPPEVKGNDERIVELLKQREQRGLDLGYNYSVKDGVIDFSATTKRQRSSAPPPAPAPAVTAAMTPPAPARPFPIIIMPEQEKMPPAELAAEIGRLMSEFLHGLRTSQLAQFQDAAVLATLLLHETTETGIVERYIGSRDRRWLCEGVANFTAWKIARDRAGADAGRAVYDLQGQLARYAELRGKIDLAKWPAVENQRKEEANTPLTKAHYAFAARAIFLMAEKRGEDFLPKLFQEIGKTPRPKTTIRTAEQAYKKLTGENLSAIITAAMAPVPAAARSVPAK